MATRKQGRSSSSRSSNRSSSRSGSANSRSRSSRSARSGSSGSTRSSSSRNTGSRKTASRSGSARSTRRSTASARGNGSTRVSRSASSRNTSRGASSSRSRTLTDHDEIRQWAEERDAQPSCVRGTGSNTGPNEIGMIRLDFPGYSGEQSLEPIEWEEWFEVFDDRGLALLVQDETAGGERSNFNKLVSREQSSGRKKPSSGRSSSRSRRAA